VILIPASIEYDLLDILAQRPFRYACADLLRSLHVPAVLQPGMNCFFRSGRGDKRSARRIVNDLRVYVTQALVYVQPRFCGRTEHFFSYSYMPSLSGF
jgi:hypothetical protein